MVELTPSQKGAAAEAAITAAVIQQGFTVLRPLCEGRRYDLIVDLEPALLRVQCKLAQRIGGVLGVRTVTSRFTPNGYVRKPYSSAEIDAIAAYAPELQASFLIPMTSISGCRGMISLRLEPTRNNQAEGVRWARDYELASVIQHLRAQPISRGG
ncbi:MAG TPA: group I intron-associated PD-(D/E)XK endonuclease [Solirubrobacteraceae bacterium]|jgi:hypothetical protein|nr:group I intron-associated PD-(D/E)XK endonuclease [Solirubrobacteraceae bacterium]